MRPLGPYRFGMRNASLPSCAPTRARLGTETELRRRFLRDAQSAARLNHPNIITVYDFGEEEGRIFMAIELLEGSDLKDLIGSHALPDLERKLDVMEQICEGLAFAHSMD